jgi:hypothetical protein
MAHYSNYNLKFYFFIFHLKKRRYNYYMLSNENQINRQELDYLQET